MSDTDILLLNSPVGEQRIQVTEALNALSGYSVFSTGGGVSKGTLWEIITIAALSCFGSSSKKDDTEEVKKLAKYLKPKALIDSLSSDKICDQDNALMLMSKIDDAIQIILKNKKDILTVSGMLGTHTDKLTNPNAPYGVIIAEGSIMKQSLPNKGLCSGNFSSRSPISASGNAAKCPAMRFLAWGVIVNGTQMCLIDTVNLWDDTTKKILGEKVEILLQQAFQELQQITKNASNLRPTSAHRVLLWPKKSCNGEDNDYTALSPLASFSLLGELEVKLRMLRRGDDRRFIRTRTIAIGGSQARNVGLIVLDTNGKFSRLLSQPMPPPIRNVMHTIKRDKLILHGGLISKDSLEAFRKSAEHEISHPITENNNRTDNMFLLMIKEVLKPLIDIIHAEQIGHELGPNLSALLTEIQKNPREILSTIEDVVFGRMGKLQLGKTKEQFNLTDAQRDRFAPLIQSSLQEEI